jgi:hypothetical protein
MTLNDKEFDVLKQPLIPDENVRCMDDDDDEKEDTTAASNEEAPTTTTTTTTSSSSSSSNGDFAAKHQIHGAAWAGGISGLLVGGPIGAIVLACMGAHFAKSNPGDVGNFCRKAGDFVCRLQAEIPKAWNEAKSHNTKETKTKSTTSSSTNN